MVGIIDGMVAKFINGMVKKLLVMELLVIELLVAKLLVKWW
jgi:hypothetical protein